MLNKIDFLIANIEVLSNFCSLFNQQEFEDFYEHLKKLKNRCEKIKNKHVVL